MPHTLDPSEYLKSATPTQLQQRRQSQHSIYAKSALMNKLNQANIASIATNDTNLSQEVLPPPAISPILSVNGNLEGLERSDDRGDLKPRARFAADPVIGKDGVGIALSDTPASSQPSSPRM